MDQRKERALVTSDILDCRDLFTRVTPAFADRYAVERLLGAGGMACVYLARDLKHNRPVAIKVFPPEQSGLLGVERFHREIQLSARLHHPHIVPLYDSGDADGLLFYVMPYEAGGSLGERLAREGSLPVSEAVRLAAEVADALAYAHAQGVLHRDIKPGNLLVSGDHLLVVDFGIARPLTKSELTRPGLVIGTPAYMSPEQALGDLSVDGRSDIYSLGCVLFEMLATTPPFEADTAQLLLWRHINDPVPSLRSLRGDVPPALENAVAQALAKRPQDRFQTATDFKAALERCLGAAEGPTLVIPGGRAVEGMNAAKADAVAMEAALERAVAYLCEKRSEKHWGNARLTAMALWMLSEVLRTDRVTYHARPRLEAIVVGARRELLDKTRPEGTGLLSWGSEGWDTSVAMIALGYADPLDDKVGHAAAWLQTLPKRENSGVWYDEIWESVLCTVALLRTVKKRRGPRQRLKEELASATRSLLGWLTSIPSATTGQFINTHYSGFILWLLAELRSSEVMELLKNDDILVAFTDKTRRAASWLVDAAAALKPDLWSYFTFANAYATYALSRAENLDNAVVGALLAASTWLARQATSGELEDVEDAALAGLAILGIAERLDPGRSIQVRHVPVEDHAGD